MSVRRLDEVKGWKEFQEHTKEFAPQSYLYDARKFSHKVYAMLDMFGENHRYVVWVDGDVVFKKRFGLRFIKKLLSKKMCAYLGRQGSYTETGFIAFDTWHKDFPTFEQRFRAMYDEKLLFLLPFWTDCHAFDAARTKLRCKNLSPDGKGVEDVFTQSPLADFLVHNKGPKKVAA